MSHPCPLCCVLTGDPDNPIPPDVGGGVYCLVEGGVPIYVGSTASFKRRRSQQAKKRPNAEFRPLHRYDENNLGRVLLEARYQARLLGKVTLNRYDAIALWKAIKEALHHDRS